MNNTEDILKIENIEVMYDSVISALHDVSLSVPRGKIVALLGGNGAGKSTTLKAISLILDKYPNTKLSVVGNPRENGHTERLIRQLNLLTMFPLKQIFLKKKLHTNISLALLQLLVLCMKVLVFLQLRQWHAEHQ